MPIYEYKCSNCQQTIEALQKFSDSPLSDCPHCRGKLKKLMSLNSFHLKGNGWYVTDYASKKPEKQPEKTKSEASGKEEKVSKSEKSDASTKSSSES